MKYIRQIDDHILALPCRDFVDALWAGDII
jgi:hypothetical protein